MLCRILACLLFLSAPAFADECDALAARIAEATGAKKAGRRVGPSIDIRSAGGIKLDLTCRGADPIVQATSSDTSPSPTYFQDLSIAAQLLVGEAEGTVRGVIGRAYETALRERRKSFIQQNGWSASCYTDTAGPFRTLCSIGRIPRG